MLSSFRQVGILLVSIFVFFAVIAALSRLLTVKQVPGYITSVTSGIANLYRGAFGK